MKEEIQQTALEAIRKGIYKKNIHFIYGPKVDLEQFEVIKALGGSPAMASWMMQKTYYKHGVQIQVSKDVTDDLLVTDFSDEANIENIPWPAPVVELYFEDPQLPTIIVMKAKTKQLVEWFPELEIGLKEEEYLNGLMQEGSDVMKAKLLSLQLCPPMYEEFLREGTTLPMKTGILSTSLSPQDNATMCYMLHLALKVFTFASIPQYKPTPLSRKQMTKGGKPDVHGRPAKPSFRVAYLPKIIKIRQQPRGGIKEHEYEFHGRRGYLRYFHHERFVHMRGKWIFIEPVVDPATGKYPERSIIKVRKPNL